MLQVIVAEAQSWLMTNVYVGEVAAAPILTEFFLECDMFEKTISAMLLLYYTALFSTLIWGKQ